MQGPGRALFQFDPMSLPCLDLPPGRRIERGTEHARGGGICQKRLSTAARRLRRMGRGYFREFWRESGTIHGGLRRSAWQVQHLAFTRTRSGAPDRIYGAGQLEADHAKLFRMLPLPQPPSGAQPPHPLPQQQQRSGSGIDPGRADAPGPAGGKYDHERPHLRAAAGRDYRRGA